MEAKSTLSSWRSALQAFEWGTDVVGVVTSIDDTGFDVALDLGLTARLPRQEVGDGSLPGRGDRLGLRIIALEETQRRISVSRRRWREAVRKRRSQIARLDAGAVCEGRVLTNSGASGWVKLGELLCCVPFAEQVPAIGSKVNLKVVAVDRKRLEISAVQLDGPNQEAQASHNYYSESARDLPPGWWHGGE